MGRRVVLFPCPFQGHLNPMLHLAAILHSRGFRITVLHTTFNSPDTTKYPHYDFLTVPVDLSGVSTQDIVALIDAINTSCKEPFCHLMAWLQSQSEEPFACVIIDALLHLIHAAANQLGLPVLLLRTGSAAFFNVFLAFPMLWEKGYIPIQDPESDLLVSVLPPYRVKDLVRIDQSSPESLREMLAQVVKGAKSSLGVIFNTFDAIEGAELEKLKRELGVHIFAIGPLHKVSPAIPCSLLAEDRSCVQWLDEQATNSVLYVSLGSLASIDGKELVEMACGLANSHQPFIWVIRPGSVQGSDRVELPEGFGEETKGRGRIVEWAPQQEVLGHPAVGGFCTHNGWNSTVESISEGVPMLCRPLFSDQMGNARFVSFVWKVGIRLENGVERGEIEKAIRTLMTGKEGEEMRERARDLKKKAAHCIQLEDGSSSMALKELEDYILSCDNYSAS